MVHKFKDKEVLSKYEKTSLFKINIYQKLPYSQHLLCARQEPLMLISILQVEKQIWKDKDFIHGHSPRVVRLGLKFKSLSSLILTLKQHLSCRLSYLFPPSCLLSFFPTTDCILDLYHIKEFWFLYS